MHSSITRALCLAFVVAGAIANGAPTPTRRGRKRSVQPSPSRRGMRPFWRRWHDFVSMEFLFVLTKKGAICKSLVHRLSDDLSEGKGFAATLKSLEKAYSATYMKRFRQYVSLVNRLKAQLQGIYGKDAHMGEIRMFGLIGEPSGFNSNYRSAHYLRDIWNTWFYKIPVVQVWTTFLRAFFTVP